MEKSEYCLFSDKGLRHPLNRGWICATAPEKSRPNYPLHRCWWGPYSRSMEDPSICCEATAQDSVESTGRMTPGLCSSYVRNITVLLTPHLTADIREPHLASSQHFSKELWVGR